MPITAPFRRVPVPFPRTNRVPVPFPDTQVETLNLMLIGWSNYFRLGPVSRSYEAIDKHRGQRLRQWLRSKHQT